MVNSKCSKRWMAVLFFLSAFGISTANAQELCVDTSMSSDAFTLKFTAASGNSYSIITNRRDLSNPYVGYGSMVLLPNATSPTRLLMSWEYQTQNGPIGYYCDIQFIFPSSNASRTTMFGGLTPSTQHGTCRLFSCSSTAAEEE